MYRAIIGAVAGALFFAVPMLLGGTPDADAAKSKGLTFYQTSAALYNPVEQWTDWVQGTYNGFPADPSLWVNNPTSCAWHVDDSTVWVAEGELLAGGSGVASLCMVSDQNPIYATHYGMTAWWSGVRNRFAVTISSPSSALIVTACYQPQARCFAVNAVWHQETDDYRYLACIQAVYDPGDPALVEVPGSNGGGREFGGFGVVTTIATTITNPTGHTIRDLRAAMEVTNVGSGSQRIGAGAALACEAGLAEINWPSYDYPFRWNVP